LPKESISSITPGVEGGPAVVVVVGPDVVVVVVPGITGPPYPDAAKADLAVPTPVVSVATTPRLFTLLVIER
jgi:hypothetical protein